MDNKNVAVSEENELTITNLKMEDTSVIQCNATNKHGYIFANAYLKVGGKSQLHLFSFCDSKNLPKLATPSTHVQLFFHFSDKPTSNTNSPRDHQLYSVGYVTVIFLLASLQYQ